MPKDVTRIYYFEVSSDESRAVYRRRFEEQVSPGEHNTRIAAVAATGNLPGVPGGFRRSGFATDLLDIYAASDEKCSYVFYLNVIHAGAQRLSFADPPFVNLPLNRPETQGFSPTEVEFLSEPARYQVKADGTSQWASFVCDLEAVRTSGLANRIRAIPEEDHKGALKIPLWFNFYDPELRGSPWVITTGDHEHDHPHEPDGEEITVKHRLPILTHGGVHPLALAELVVEL